MASKTMQTYVTDYVFLSVLFAIVAYLWMQ